MSNRPSDQDNFYDWMLASNMDEAHSTHDHCICGFTATYKDRKDAKDYLKLKYMHSHWCNEYMEKEEYERRYGEQEKTRK